MSCPIKKYLEKLKKFLSKYEIPLLSIINKPVPISFHYGLEGMQYIIQLHKVRSMDTERSRVYRPNANTSLNRRCWNTFTISRTRSERTDGFKEIPQRFPKPRFWGVKIQIQNWDSSSSNEIMSSMLPPTRHSF